MENNQPLKILIVDDEEGIVDFLQDIYSRKGFTTFGATEGITAVEIFKKEKPQVCFIDVWMRRGTHEGIEVLKRIKDIDRDTYCIMMGPCLDQENTVKQAKDLGALHFIVKPFETEVLDECIQEIRSLIAKK
jgi:DNA-binding NtrC family response regulator